MTETSLPSSTKTHSTMDLDISPELNRAVQSIVFNKYLIDRAVSDHGTSMLARDLHDGAYGPHVPMSFISYVLPFHRACARTDDGSPSYQFASVPTANTLGCSWRWRRKSLDKKAIEKCRDHLSDFGAMVNGKVDDATYAWVKPLGLFVPSEGKNRVDFLREVGVESIPARVYERTYPEPSRITIYSIQVSAFSATWAVLDGRWVENIPNPSWTLPLMKAYGVKGPVPWPSGFPEPEQIQLALFMPKGITSPLGNPEFGDEPVVDLKTVIATQNFEDESVRASVFDLRDAKIDHRVWQISLGIMLTCFVLLSLVPDEFAEARIFVGMALGAAMMGGVMPYIVPFVTTKRRSLAQNQYLPRTRAPKNNQSV